MLKDEDRIFKNLYNDFSWDIDSAINRGDWIHTKDLISKGKGWVISKQGIIIAFATRFPTDRIALFYCKGTFQRKGYGSKLLHKLEDEAKKEGLDSLSTEASLISYELFLKNDWKIIRKEKVIINNIFFERYKMTKIIKIN